MVLALVIRLEPDDLEEKTERGWHDTKNGALALRLMIGPVGPLALLTTVLSVFALGASAQSNIGHEAIWIARVLALLRPWIVHFKAPAAVL